MPPEQQRSQSKIWKVCSMNLANRTALLASTLLLSSITHASSNELSDTLKAFTNCDASFFTSIHAHSNAWEKHVPLERAGEVAWIAVENRARRTANSVPVRGAPEVAGLKLLSYSDESSDLGSMGYYFFWGFIAEGSTKEVAQHLSSLIDHPEHLQALGQTYVRSEIKDGNRWRPVKPIPGAPGTERLERVLLIEPVGGQTSRTRITCSLQGAVDAATLAELRPDIPETDYPQEVPDTAIDNVSLPVDLTEALDSPLLQPKFKSLLYTYTSTKKGTNKTSTVSIALDTEGSLLRKTETYSKTFHVDRLVKADLIQLKAKMNGIGANNVLVTQELDAAIPASWSTGQILSARMRREYVPATPQDEASETYLECKVGGRFPARQIFESLSGDAIELECNQGDYRTTQAFIEDLGVAMTLKSMSGSGEHVYKINSLEFTR